MAAARDLRGEQFHVVAIIGDGALTGGMALEALNNAGALRKNLIVVLNDNDKSISDNVGALHAHLGKMRTDKNFRRLRNAASQSLKHVPGGELAKEVAGRTARSAKEFVLPSKTGVIFEELGFTFLGPFDGHNTQEMIEVFRKARADGGPDLHPGHHEEGAGAATSPRPSRPSSMAPAPMIRQTGELKKSDGPPTFSDVFGKAMVELARRDPSDRGASPRRCPRGRR